MNQIPRLIEKRVKDRLFKGKIIVIYGARQVGKTTLVKNIIKDFGEDARYVNCEHLPAQNALTEVDPEKIRNFLGEHKIIVLDEAQSIVNIGKILKVMVDTYPEAQIIATGSSSFDLAQKISEPLTGRIFTFMLYPISLKEIRQKNDLLEIESKIESLLRFGSYPEVIGLTDDLAREKINEIASNYLYKDILSFEGLKKSSVIKNLLKLLALQVGQEVSYNELAVNLGVSRITVQKYIDILEQSFVVFRLEAFSRNLRKEISKSVKIYFCDLGIRNSLIENYNRPELRSDAGALWENFCILERRKNNAYLPRYANTYFWRTYDQKEVDYIEEGDGKITGYEFKLSDKKTFKPPKEFMEKYDAKVEMINRKNYWKFLEL